MPEPEIAFDLTPLQNAHRYRGIGTYVRGLAVRLMQQKDVPIEFWGWDGEPSFAIEPPHRKLLLTRIPMPRYRGAWLFAQLATRRRAMKSRVKAVHVTDPEALTALPPRKLLATVYDLIPLKQGIGRRRALARAGYDSYLKGLRKADVLFAISEQTAGDIVEMLRVPASRIRIAKPGVDLPRSEPRTVRRARQYFLYLGGPNPNKNLGVLLDAMAQCTELEEELRIGGYWLPKQVAALEAQTSGAELRGRVRHIGFVPEEELTALIRDATAVIIPSLQEGFGLPVAEGLAAGALVIHSRLPVLEATSGGAALVFDPTSATALADCLRRAAHDPELQKSLRGRALEQARQITWDAAIKTTLTTYEAILRE